MVLAPAIVSADDFAPPPWDRPSAPNPFAITAEWEFLSSANPLAPDGPLTDLTSGSGMVPGGISTAFILGDGSEFWSIGDGDGMWSFPTTSTIHFELDNVLDTEPIKNIRMQITHSPGALVLVDPLSSFNLAGNGSTADIPDVSFFDATHTLITWNMFPNPPWEEFDLIIPPGTEIDQVLVDTVSVPEPTSLVLCSIGAMVIGAGAWQRRKRSFA